MTGDSKNDLAKVFEKQERYTAQNNKTSNSFQENVFKKKRKTRKKIADHLKT